MFKDDINVKIKEEKCRMIFVSNRRHRIVRDHHDHRYRHHHHFQDHSQYHRILDSYSLLLMFDTSKRKFFSVDRSIQ